MRRRLIAALAGAVAAGALIAVWGLQGRAGHGPSAPPARTATGKPRGEVAAGAQAQAVARVARLGLPLYRSGRRGRYVALTFDDGPGPMTGATLAKLRAAGARGTFFLVGANIPRWPQLPAREAALGAVGDHTWSHPFLPRLGRATQLRQMGRAQAATARSTGAPVTLFRPPYGGRDRVIDREARRLGMLEVMWSVDSGDSESADWRRIVANVRAGLRPGAIILFHENRGQTQKALNRLLPEIRRRGFTAVTVPELLALDPPTVAQVRADAGGGGVRAGG